MKEVQTKRCSCCGETKPLTEFYVKKKRGPDSQCKKCVSELGKRYRQSNPEREVTRRKKYNQAHREDLAYKNKKYRAANYAKRMLASAFQRAKKKGLPFGLTSEDIQLPVFCPILGLKLDYGIKNGGALPNSPSLDKIAPELGYVKGNVQVVSMKANQIKSCATPEEILLVARYFGLMS